VRDKEIARDVSLVSGDVESELTGRVKIERLVLTLIPYYTDPEGGLALVIPPLPHLKPSHTS
jgi:hypothetical protein